MIEREHSSVLNPQSKREDTLHYASPELTILIELIELIELVANAATC